MRSSLVLSALVGFVAASPLAAPAPQDLDFDAIDVRLSMEGLFSISY